METGLTSVTIPSNVTNIGAYAFYKCNITKVISMIKNPFKIDTTVFSSYTFKNATLSVPEGSATKYKNTGGWTQFISIEEIR